MSATAGGETNIFVKIKRFRPFCIPPRLVLCTVVHGTPVPKLVFEISPIYRRPQASSHKWLYFRPCRHFGFQSTFESVAVSNEFPLPLPKNVGRFLVGFDFRVFFSRFSRKNLLSHELRFVRAMVFAHMNCMRFAHSFGVGKNIFSVEAEFLTKNSPPKIPSFKLGTWCTA